MASRIPRLGTIFSIVFLDLLGFGILIPQLGIYGYQFHASPLTVGLLLTSYSAMQLLFAPVLGQLSDRYGRRPVLLFSVAGSLFGYVLFAFAHALPLLFLSRIIDGISGGNISTAQAYVADITTPENRAAGMGIIGAAFGLGFILGPAVGGLLGAWGGNFAIGLVAASLAGVNFVMTWRFLPESRHAESESAAGKSLKNLWAPLRLPLVGLALVLFLLFTTAFSQMEATFSLFIISDHLKHAPIATHGSLFVTADETDAAFVERASLLAGYLFAAVGVVSTVIQGGLIGTLKKRFGEHRLVVAGACLTALGLFTVPMAPTYAWLFGPTLLLAAGSALLNPSLSALVSMHAPKDRQGQTLGAYQAMGSLGRIIGPATGGLLFTVGGSATPYVTAGFLMLGCVVLGIFLFTRVRASATT